MNDRIIWHGLNGVESVYRASTLYTTPYKDALSRQQMQMRELYDRSDAGEIYNGVSLYLVT
ncbi:hypothetical protein BO70DRAFT_365445 [Aspergillus heteromorphus CBS 117.55]|uniref:Uncharacterized protein n=1 Tax=Aspergillus heteromorphus CBS 117.55 TaxID=1448321 RepID=A0A317VB75_9EURO|nr:uncharacterized protein BO70DRAFT_365381 [Aspergillus heteromorphus CBS 117.55]XP_025395998.1 uncharacterized protein BO70DRAFT_365445 [Aspergillus heteromorphus CBS 117.55]PWY70437.1 hypothetical protein BO70DRAFT_365381 [Aspergillus heteromorphus CBS 117.55]PWY70511.1 hypothetical protein BO70DRAFT_365445 [Aspergillus heteromorphus CBS 117.55]